MLVADWLLCVFTGRWNRAHLIVEIPTSRTHKVYARSSVRITLTVIKKKAAQVASRLCFKSGGQKGLAHSLLSAQVSLGLKILCTHE